MEARKIRASRPIVAILYRYIPAYRAPFYEALRKALDECGIDLRLVVGEPTGSDAFKLDAIDLDWAIRIRNRTVPLGAKELVWQPAMHHLSDADLIVVEQASRLLINYVLLARRRFSKGSRLAFWGHGANFQRANAVGPAEWAKSHYSTWVDWWFAYNECSAKVVEGYGFSRERITVVRNAIDDQSLREEIARAKAVDSRALLADLGVSGGNVCAFLGSMYPDKRLGFLLEAAKGVRERVPDFELLLVGSGPDEHRARSAARDNDWVRYLGARFDAHRAAVLAVSKLLLVPGAVGLVVLDSFVAGVPLVTTEDQAHGPEFDYLEPGRNGVVVRPGDSTVHYAEAITEMLLDEDRRTTIASRAIESSYSYSIGSMVARFSEGIQRALRC